MNENAETNGKVKELVSIFVECFPEYDGPRVNTDKRVGDGIHKYSMSLPAPRDAETHAEVYGPHFTFENCIDNGNRQRGYDDANAIKNLCQEAVIEGGNDPNDEEMIDAVREAMEEAMCREATRRVGGKAKKQRETGKKVENLAASLGLTEDEIFKLIKEAAEAKAQE